MSVTEGGGVGGKPFWGQRYDYRHYLLIFVALSLVGFGLEYLRNPEYSQLPGFPLNVILLVIWILILVFFHWRVPRITMALRSGPYFFVFTLGFVFWCVLAGVITDPRQLTPLMAQLGLGRLTHHWGFIFSFMALTSGLFMVCLKRAWPWRPGNLVFMLNHFGVWLTIVGGFLGASDLIRADITLFEGQVGREGTTRGGGKVYLPFAVGLKEFRMEQYPPTMSIINAKGKARHRVPLPSADEIKPSDNFRLGDFEVQIERFMPYAFYWEEQWHPTKHPGTVPVAYVQIRRHSSDNPWLAGVLSGYSRLLNPSLIRLEGEQALVLESPKPKHFASDVLIHTPDGGDFPFTLEVNKPLRHAGWILYQSSYDQDRGPDSQFSVIEAIYDPWLPVVYLGIFFMIAGAVGFIFQRPVKRGGDV